MFGSPAAARKVGNQSSPEMMPFSTLPAGTLPGQRIIAGTRKPPSKTVPLLWANGVCPPSGQVKTSVPLSVVKTTMVLSSTPMSLSFGIVMQKLKDIGVDDNTIVVFTTDNGTEVFTWPDGGQTPFAQSKGTVFEGGFRVPAMIRWPGKVPAGKVENGIISGLDWFPTFLAAAGNPNIVDELKKGKQIGDTTFKCHLDGYNQMDMTPGDGQSNRHEIWYFGESELGAVRIDDFK